MFRRVLAVAGVVETLLPERLVDAAERSALSNPDECDLKWWVPGAARAEGVFFLYLAWRSDAAYSVFKTFLGAVGLFALAAPSRFVDSLAELAYVDPATCRWHSWVYTFVRLLGVLYVLIALDELRRD